MIDSVSTKSFRGWDVGLVEWKEVVPLGVPGGPWLCCDVAPQRELDGFGDTDLGEPTNVVIDGGVADAVVLATPRQHVFAEGRYGTDKAECTYRCHIHA